MAGLFTDWTYGSSQSGIDLDAVDGGINTTVIDIDALPGQVLNPIEYVDISFFCYQCFQKSIFTCWFPSSEH